MDQEPPGPGRPQGSERPPDEDRLSGTLFSHISGGLQGLARGLGRLSTTFAFAGIVGLVLGVILLIFVPDLRLYGYIIVGAAGIMVLVSVVISFQTVSQAVIGRRGRYSTNTGIMIVAFIAIAAVANFLAFENTARVDVTATRQFSLAPRSEELLKNLSEPVEATAFFVPARDAEQEAILEVMQSQVEDLLREFKVRSGKFSYEFADPEIDLEAARYYEITRYPTIVFESMESKKNHQVSPSVFMEQDFVTALLIVTGQEQKRVYFLTGHGERNIGNFERDTAGSGFAHEAVKAENYAVSSINLLAGGKEILLSTGDARGKEVNMVVVAGPKDGLLEGEAQILDDYLRAGGKMLFLLEPDTPQSFRDLLARWGIVVGRGHIVDRQRSLGGSREITFLSRGQYIGALPESFQFLDSLLRVGDITGNLDTTYYPGLTSIEAADGVEFFPPRIEAVAGQDNEEQADDGDVTIFGTALAVTSSDSWMINDPTRNEPQAGDRKDFFFPAVAVRAFAPLGEELPSSPTNDKIASIVVFGDSDFVSNRYFYDANNSDFFLNSVNWLVGDIALASIRPKPFAFRQLILTRNERHFVQYSSWLLPPLLMALAGGFVWWRRR